MATLFSSLHPFKVGSQERYRVILSDGELYMQGMLASQLNEFVADGRMKEVRHGGEG